MDRALLVCIYPPLPPGGFDSSDPLLGQSLVAGTTQLPCIALHARLARIFWFDIEPEMIHWDAIAVDCR